MGDIKYYRGKAFNELAKLPAYFIKPAFNLMLGAIKVRNCYIEKKKRSR